MAQRKSDKKPVVLVTGAAGAIGTAVTKALEENYRVVGLDLVCGPVDGPCYEFDIGDMDAVEETLAKVRKRIGKTVAAVVHLAAYFDFTGEEHPLYETVNVRGTRNLMKGLQAFDVERFIFSGTMLVHEPARPGGRIDESAPVAPQWAYPISKAKAEDEIRTHRGDIPVTLLHLAGLYDEKTAVPTLSHQIARIYERDLKAHLYSGDPQAGQSMIHIDDMVELFRRAVEKRADMPEECVILAGEPEGVPYAELQRQLGQLIHGREDWETIAIPKPAAKAGAWVEEKSEPVVPDAIDRGEKPFIRPFMVDMASDHYSLDISRAKELLGWEPKHDIRDVLPKMVAHLKADPVGWYEANDITAPDWLETVEDRIDEPEEAETIRERYTERTRKEHAQHRWAHLTNAALGLWLITSPPVLSYESTALVWSDVLTGVVLVIAGLFAASWRFEMARWVTAAAGFWLLWAPLIFWAPTAEAYLNQTLVGALVIGFSLCTRPEPGVSVAAAETGPDIPPGWEFSPSTWAQRLPIIILAIVGLLISRHLTAYQLGHIAGIWDPFFGSADPQLNGSEYITTSKVSEAWPVPDAGIGALTYMLEILTGIIGTSRRWRTMPWLVMLFGIMIVPLGVVSITFIVIQPLMLGTYCTLCLVAAAAMVIQIPYSLDELLATSQFLYRRKKQGRPLLRIFFTGDTDEGEAKAKPEFEMSFTEYVADMWAGGITLVWSLVLSTLAGVWLLATPWVLGTDGYLADANHLIGSLVITTSVIAFAEIGRAIRWLNAGFGLAVMVTTVTLGPGLAELVTGLVAGAALIGLSIPRGPVKHSYGGFDRIIV